MNTPIKKKKQPKIELVRPTGKKQKMSLKGRFKNAARNIAGGLKNKGYFFTAKKNKSTEDARKIMEKRNAQKKKK